MMNILLFGTTITVCIFIGVVMPDRWDGYTPLTMLVVSCLMGLGYER